MTSLKKSYFLIIVSDQLVLGKIVQRLHKVEKVKVKTVSGQK